MSTLDYIKAIYQSRKTNTEVNIFDYSNENFK